MPKAKRRAALLIDCDNVSHAHLDWILEQVADKADLQISRAYGDFDSARLAGWQAACDARAVQIFQATAHVKGKNASDLVLAINAMDLLHDDKSDVFYIVTNDSDFVHLAARLQTGGKTVVGIVKEESAGKPFASSCNRILTLPAKTARAQAAKKPPKAKTATAQTAAKEPKAPTKPPAKKKRSPAWVPRIAEIVRTLSASGECPPLSTLGTRLKQAEPPIDYKALDFKRLTDMLESETDVFQIQSSSTGSRTRVCLTANARKAR